MENSEAIKLDKALEIREDLPKKECLLLGIARIRGGRPLPEFFGPFLQVK